MLLINLFLKNKLFSLIYIFLLITLKLPFCILSFYEIKLFFKNDVPVALPSPLSRPRPSLILDFNISTRWECRLRSPFRRCSTDDAGGGGAVRIFDSEDTASVERGRYWEWQFNYFKTMTFRVYFVFKFHIRFEVFCSFGVAFWYSPILSFFSVF